MKKFIWILSLFILGLDQVVKYLIIGNFHLYTSVRVIPNFFYITYARNDGAAFGIFEDGRWYFIILSLIAIASVIGYIFSDKKIEKIEAISYALVLGGILGNLVDRIIYGYVIDYLDFYIFGFDTPIFNIADSCIVVGILIVMYNLIVKGEPNEISTSRRGRKRG